MPAGSALRLAFKQLIQEVIDEQPQNVPDAGSVVNVNSDGTVDIQGTVNMYFSVGYPDPNVVVGTEVLVLNGQGTFVAIPK